MTPQSIRRRHQRRRIRPKSPHAPFLSTIRQNTTFEVVSRNQRRAIPTIKKRMAIDFSVCVLVALTVAHGSFFGENAM
jgi:hypothetical protein